MQNLEVEINSGAGGAYRVAVRSDAAGDTQATPTRFPFDEQMLARRLEAVEFALVRSAATVRRLAPPDEQPVQEFGRQLFEFLFPAEVREHLNAVRRQAAQEDTQVQVRLRIGPPELAALPWEFLYDPGRDDYLCLSTPLVRYLDVQEPRRPLAVPPPLRILGMVARPGELDTLNVDHEKRRLQQALAQLESSGGVQLTWVEGQTWWDLQSALDQGGWHIFHFIGHGGFDQQSGEGILALADEDGGVYRLAASDLGLLLGEHWSLRLVVLNSCESARASASDVFSSTAAVLMRRGIPAVVAMQYDISDQAAIAFARGLYTGVAGRHPVDQAVTRARRAIKLAHRNTLEWATPVLYLRSARAELFDLAGFPAAAEAVPAEPEPDAPHRPGDDLTQEASQATWPDSAARHRQTVLPPRAPREPIGSELARMHHDGEVMEVAFSLDGTRLATASDDNTARLWEAATGRQLARMEHDDRVWAVAFNPDGTRLATGSLDNTARLWEAATGRQLARMEHDDRV
ncbi:MAG: CHAT domain-containing protein, partial [Mycobacteriaceae bacterium]